jgi:hypothetical protein
MTSPILDIAMLRSAGPAVNSSWQFDLGFYPMEIMIDAWGRMGQFDWFVHDEESLALKLPR